MPSSWSGAETWINRYRKYYCRAAAQSFLVYFCEKIRCGTNLARLRISVWFVGDPAEICPGSGLVLGSRACSYDLRGAKRRHVRGPDSREGRFTLVAPGVGASTRNQWTG